MKDQVLETACAVSDRPQNAFARVLNTGPQPLTEQSTWDRWLQSIAGTNQTKSVPVISMRLDQGLDISQTRRMTRCLRLLDLCVDLPQSAQL